MDRVIVTWDDSDAERFFRYAGYRARNMRDPLVRSRTLLLHHVNLTFEAEGIPGWRPLDPSYERWKMSKVGQRPMLVFSGKLRRKAISPSAGKIRGYTLEYVVDVPYAAAQQHGGWVDDDGREHPPARPFLSNEEVLVPAIRAEFIAWLEDLRRESRARGGTPMTNPASLAGWA